MTLKRHLLAILVLGLIGCFLGQTLFAETLVEAPSNFHDEDAIRGQLVRRSSDFQLNNGNTLFVWDRKDMNNLDVASGVYFYRIQMNDEITSGKFLVIR